MSENKHTPEPWRTAERSGFPFHIDDARGESVAVMLADDDHDEQRGLDNARRIVACVNACAGIPNEQLECDNVEFVRIFNERNTLKQQRDELQEEVNALKEIAKYDLAEFARTLDISYDEIKLLKKQRDGLLAALEKITDVFANIGITSGLYDDEQDALKSACAAIASAEESK